MIQSIGKNKFKTAIIVGGIFAFFSVVIYFIAYLLGADPMGAAVMGLSFSFITSFVSYWFSDSIVIKLSGGNKPTPEQERIIRPILEKLCVQADLPMPKFYVSYDASPNAFATGRNHKHSSVCVTTGLLNTLNNEQIEGVLAHEMAHIKNYDILLQTVASVMIGAALIAANFCSRMMFWGGSRRRDDDNGGSNIIFVIIGLIFMILAPIAGQLLKLSLSRNREYLADATAASITGNPEGLASALEIIGGVKIPVKRATEATECMYISNPLKAENISKLFSTHPPIGERVRLLREMKNN